MVEMSTLQKEGGKLWCAGVQALGVVNKHVRAAGKVALEEGRKHGAVAAKTALHMGKAAIVIGKDTAHYTGTTAVTLGKGAIVVGKDTMHFTGKTAVSVGNKAVEVGRSAVVVGKDTIIYTGDTAVYVGKKAIVVGKDTIQYTGDTAMSVGKKAIVVGKDTIQYTGDTAVYMGKKAIVVGKDTIQYTGKTARDVGNKAVVMGKDTIQYTDKTARIVSKKAMKAGKHAVVVGRDTVHVASKTAMNMSKDAYTMGKKTAVAAGQTAVSVGRKAAEVGNKAMVVGKDTLHVAGHQAAVVGNKAVEVGRPYAVAVGNKAAEIGKDTMTAAGVVGTAGMKKVNEAVQVVVGDDIRQTMQQTAQASTRIGMAGARFGIKTATATASSVVEGVYTTTEIVIAFPVQLYKNLSRFWTPKERPLVLEPIRAGLEEMLLCVEQARSRNLTLPDLLPHANAIVNFSMQFLDVVSHKADQTGDNVLKNHLPRTCCAVRDASKDLISAAEFINFNGHSLSYSPKLEEAARCLLRATSDVLNTLDDAVIRAIVCKANAVLLFVKSNEFVRDRNSFQKFNRDLAPIVEDLAFIASRRVDDIVLPQTKNELMQACDELYVRSEGVQSALRPFIQQEISGNAVMSRDVAVQALIDVVHKILMLVRRSTAAVSLTPTAARASFVPALISHPSMPATTTAATATPVLMSCSSVTGGDAEAMQMLDAQVCGALLRLREACAAGDAARRHAGVAEVQQWVGDARMTQDMHVARAFQSVASQSTLAVRSPSVQAAQESLATACDVLSAAVQAATSTAAPWTPSMDNALARAARPVFMEAAKLSAGLHGNGTELNRLVQLVCMKVSTMGELVSLPARRHEIVELGKEVAAHTKEIERIIKLVPVSEASLREAFDDECSRLTDVSTQLRLICSVKGRSTDATIEAEDKQMVPCAEMLCGVVMQIVQLAAGQ